MKRVLKVLSVSILIFLFSCTKDYYTPPGNMPENVSFSSSVIPIFNNNCVSCHNSGSTEPDLTPDNAYADLTANNAYVVPGKPEDSKLYHRITGQGSLMPPGGSLPQNDINIIYVWIKEGALNN